MLKHREIHITHIIAVHEGGKILPPCGRCRELILQLGDQNLNTQVLLPENKVETLENLYGESWVKYN